MPLGGGQPPSLIERHCGCLNLALPDKLTHGLLITLRALSVDTELGIGGAYSRQDLSSWEGSGVSGGLPQLFPLLLDSRCREWLRISGSGSGREGRGRVTAGLSYGPREVVRYENINAN